MRRTSPWSALVVIGLAFCRHGLALAAEVADDDDALSDVDVVASPPAGGDRETAPPPSQSSPSSPVANGLNGAGGAPALKAPAPQVQWERAPIAWRGLLSTSYSQTWADDAPSQRAWGKSAEFFGSSYVYAPWLVKLDGTLRASQFDVYGAAATGTRSYGGDLRVSVFPVSRFPFSASIANNVIEAGDVKSSLTSYSLSQAYRPPSGAYAINGAYGRDIFRVADGTSDVADRFTGGYTYNFTTEVPQSFETTWNASQSRPSSGVNRTQNFDVRGRHTASLYDDYGLTFDNEAAYRRGSFGGNPAVQDSGSAVTYGFAQSKVDWEPFVDLPLLIRSALRYTKTELTAGASSSFFENVGFETSTGYSFGRYLRVTLGLRADYIRTQEESRSVYTYTARADSGYGQGAGGIKEFDILGFRYRLSYDANAGVDANTEGNVAPFVGATLIQSLVRNFDVGFGMAAPLMFDFTQSYGAIWRDRLQPRTLGNVLTLQWQGYKGPYMVGSKLVATDSQTYGVENAPWFQSLAWDNTARAQLSPASSISGGLNVSWSRQGVREGAISDLTDGRWLGNGRATVSYQNVRFLDVPRLRYTADYNNFFSPGLLADSFQSDLGGTRVGQTFTQRLQYAVGLLSLSASHSLSYGNGSIAQALYFTLSRSLSGVL